MIKKTIKNYHKSVRQCFSGKRTLGRSKTFLFYSYSGSDSQNYCETTNDLILSKTGYRNRVISRLK